MYAFVGLALILAPLCPWLFLKFKPWHDNEYTVDVFNRMILGVCALLVVTWCVGSWIYLSRHDLDSKYGWLIPMVGGVGIEVAFLAVFALVRLWIFKSGAAGMVQRGGGRRR